MSVQYSTTLQGSMAEPRDIKYVHAPQFWVPSLTIGIICVLQVNLAG